jgi:RND superfamily putative drug exporter
MFELFAKAITRWWWAVILIWIAVAVGVRAVAPRWDDITYDGDLAYLPDTLPSYVGEKLLEDAFPQDRAKSQIVLVIARDDEPLAGADFDVAYDVARRFKNYHGITSFERAKSLRLQAEEFRASGNAAEAERTSERADVALEEATIAFEEAIALDNQMWRQHERRASEAAAAGQRRTPPPPRLAEAYWNRARLHAFTGAAKEAQSDRAQALELNPKLQDAADAPLPAEAASMPILDVWTWRDPLFGAKLGDKHKQARLVVLHLSNEFMATENIDVLQQVESELASVKHYGRQIGVMPKEAGQLASATGVQVGISGSAAVGGDMLRSAHESIKNTELFTIIIVVAILIAVYRSPLLVLVPLITIWASLQVAMGVVALLTQLHLVPGFAWWDLKVFTTTKIFIVVILFGAGTDFCLFLIARFKEELEHGHELASASGKSLFAVSDALIASAMTTILGLGMMFFADFGKYRNSGPVIGLCLFVTLIACLTLAPALLRAFGKWIFWPIKITQRTSDHPPTLADRAWTRLARTIVAYPLPILIGSVLILFPLAYHGFWSGDHVTYDFLSGLADTTPSKQGTLLLQKHFPVGESGPLVVLAKREGAQFDERDGRAKVRELSDELYVEGVESVRSISDPLGEFAPGERRGLSNIKALRAWASSPHRKTAEIYVSQAPQLAGDVTRLELVLKTDPFDIASLQTLAAVDQKLKELKEAPDSYWADAEFAYAGPTAGVRDLRDVTRSDNRRIQVLVVIAVYVVLVIMLRQPVICAYMIVSVLFSYFVTIGATEAFFMWAYGPGYPGLDWKVPLFLFVILVAVGEDYNVYLATRVQEEQKRHGPFSGLRKAIVKTGGIITSCGIIMAGTFISMTASMWGQFIPEPFSSWLFATEIGALRGIVELGFALALGVLLDTFIVRPILVPAFIALLAQRQAFRPRNSRPRRRSPHAPHKPRVAETVEEAR